MDDKISQQLVSSKKTTAKENDHKNHVHNHKHSHNHKDSTHNNDSINKDFENNILEFDENKRQGQSYDEFYVSGVD